MDVVPPRHDAGFTLVEVMVAASVLAIGLLGGGASLLAAVRTSHEAQLRTRATALAYDLLDRIRANEAAVGSYALREDEDAPVSGTDCAAGSPCSPAEWAAVDLHEWQLAARAALPAVVTVVTAEPLEGGGASYVVTLRWSVPGRDEPDELTLSTES